jgi:septal ring factor EnvC (AmiA/AmiB activator)
MKSLFLRPALSGAMLLCAMLPWAACSWAADESPQEIEAKLQALESEISKYKEALDKTRGEHTNLEDTLQRNEKGISDLIKEIDDIETELDTGKNKVSQLNLEQKELQQAKSEQQYYIERQIRAAYEIGNQEYLKVLLNQDDPDEMARMLTYYDYFNRARAEQIESYNTTLLRLDEVALELTNENRKLTQNHESLVTQKTALTMAQVQKRLALAALTRQIAETGSEITKLSADRERLEALMERIQASRLANIATPGSAQPFSGMQGKLLLPVTGKISHRFGHQRNEGKLKWHGVFIDAPEGDPVHAVHYGRVVFSDWLRGFGLLLIISHGDGYMSLYGHNQVLYQETGDWVTAGDIIATVGDSGGQNKTGLYFEIRIAGKPSDPQLWCAARKTRAA